MRFITRKEFLKIEVPTLFAKYEDECFYGYGIKVSNHGKNDWVYNPLDAGAFEEYGPEEREAKLKVQERNAHSGEALELGMDFDIELIDQWKEKNSSLIAIYDQDDILALVMRLTTLLPNYELIVKPVESEITRMRKIHSDTVIDPDVESRTMEQHVGEVEKFLHKD